MSSTYGKIFKISTFGESHGKAIGVIVDGCPAGVDFDENFIQNELDRRKPGQSRSRHNAKSLTNSKFFRGFLKAKQREHPSQW